MKSIKLTLAKIQRVLLVVILSAGVNAETALSQSDEAIEASECVAKRVACTCYLPSTIDIIAADLMAFEKCEAESLSKTVVINSLRNNPPPLEWWQEPEYVVGGMVVSFTFGGILLYLASK